MKQAFVALILVGVVALIVLPLVYIGLGKIKSPIDKLSVAGQGSLSGQNYIPVSYDQAEADQLSNSKNAFDLDMEKACNASGTTMIAKDITTLFNVPQKKASISSDMFRFVWNLKGEYADAKTYGTGSGAHALIFGGGVDEESVLVTSVWGGKYNSPECVQYMKRTFGPYHDAGRFLKEYAWEKNGMFLMEKGMTRINGATYYWYMFEDTRKRGEVVETDETGGSLLSEDKISNQAYTVIYDTFNNGIKYRISFTGDKAQNKSYRRIMQIANGTLGGLIFR